MALISVMVCIAAFAFGLGPAQKAYFGEIFPLRARGKAAGLTAAFTYVWVFVVASCFSYMMVSKCISQQKLAKNSPKS